MPKTQALYSLSSKRGKKAESNIAVHPLTILPLRLSLESSVILDPNQVALAKLDRKSECLTVYSSLSHLEHYSLMLFILAMR